MVRFDWSRTLPSDVFIVLLWKLGIKQLHQKARSHSCSNAPRYEGFVQVPFCSTFDHYNKYFLFKLLLSCILRKNGEKSTIRTYHKVAAGTRATDHLFRKTVDCILLVSYELFDRLYHYSVSVSLYTLGKLASRLATLAGSFTALSTASSPMVRCRPTRLSAEGTIPSTRSSARPVLESTFLVPCSLTWSQPL